MAQSDDDPATPVPAAGKRPARYGRDSVAAILAACIGITVIILAAGAEITAIVQGQPLSEQAANVLSTLGGGVIGVLGSYMGFMAGVSAERARHPDQGSTPEP